MASGRTVVDAVCYGVRSPAQWYVRFAGRRVAYIRYRWGKLSAKWVLEAETVDLIDSAVTDRPFGDTWFERQIGDELDGEIAFSRACNVLGLELVSSGSA